MESITARTKRDHWALGLPIHRCYTVHSQALWIWDQNIGNGYWKSMALWYEEKVPQALRKWQEEEGNTLAPEASLRTRTGVPDPLHKDTSLDFWYREYVHVIGVLQQLRVDVVLEKHRGRSLTITPTFNPQPDMLQVPHSRSQLPQDTSQVLGQHFMDPTFCGAYVQGPPLYPASFLQCGTGYSLRAAPYQGVAFPQSNV